MRCRAFAFVVVAALPVIIPLLTKAALGQYSPKSVTVPATIDHGRVIIDVDLNLPDGSTKRVRGWVDNGDPDFTLSRRVATLLGLSVTCDDKACSALPPRDITIAGMTIPLTSVKSAKIPLKPPSAANVMAAGMAAGINIPSTILRNYDVLINFPGHEFTLASPGVLKFSGSKTKVLVNPEDGLIQVPSQIDKQKYNLALDVGSSMSFISEELFDKLAGSHPNAPRMTGAVGPANLWGLDDEPQWKLMRLDRLQFGSLFLTNVPVVSFPKDRMAYFAKRAGVPTAGLIGADVLANYRVGIDFAHSTVYFDIGRLFNFPEFDVIGLILRPEDNGRFTILGVADYDGKPSVPGVQKGDQLTAVDGIPVPGNTMGQVWLMLGGEPGKERRLTVEREGKQFTVTATVRHFLGEAPDKDELKKTKP